MLSPRGFWRCVLVLIVLTPLLGACVPSGGLPADVPDDLPLPPPRLVDRTPEPGADLEPGDAITLTFDQAMDRASVEAAFAITPTISGNLRWRDARTLTFAPGTSLERDARYRVTVGASAKNAAGLQVAEPIAFDLSTAGHLMVRDVQPAPGTEDLPPDTTVTVVFDRPVVPLTSVASQEGLPQPLTFEPPVAGSGEWINTAVYRFRPTEGFLPATAYEARVAGDLTDTLGHTMAEPYAWTFDTISPRVLDHYPANLARHVGPNATITVTFNQPMDHASVEDVFSLVVEGEPIAGTFRWSGGTTPYVTETVAFVPDDLLPRNIWVRGDIGAGARTRTGSEVLRPYDWGFRTVREPGVLFSAPQDGAEEVNPRGDVEIDFASPMLRAGFMEHLHVTPAVTDVYTYWSGVGDELHVAFPKEPNTTYELTIDAAAPDRYGAPLGEAFTLRFTTGDLPPSLLLNVASDTSFFNVNSPDEPAVYASYRNLSTIDVELYRLDPQGFTKLIGPWYSDEERYHPGDAALIRAWSVEPVADRNEIGLVGVKMTGAGGEALPPGLYYVEFSSPEILNYQDDAPERFPHLFAISGINLTLKLGLDEALIWATDAASGEPVPDLPVELYDAEYGEMGRGTTGADGLLSLSELDLENLWESCVVFAGSPGADDFGVVSSQREWGRGIFPWSFDVPEEYGLRPYRGYLYADRPLYRPGQTVYFKGIVRAEDDAHYTLPEDLVGSLRLTITDPEGKVVYEERFDLNEMGTLHGEWSLDAEAALGTYRIYVTDASEELLHVSHSFRVAEYRKPEYQIAVQADRDAYLNGDDVEVTAEASYYFGGPVADADAEWHVLSAPHTFRYTCPHGERCPRYSWHDYGDWRRWRRGDDNYGSYGKLIAEGETSTNAEGRVAFEVPAEIDAETTSRRFTFEVTVTDVNGQSVSQRTAAVVHRGAFYVGVAPRSYLAKVNEEQTFDLLTVGWESAPVAGVPLSVTFVERNWYSVRERADDGRYYWSWEVEEIPVLTTTGTTGAAGKAETAFLPPRAGMYRAIVAGEDEHGNRIRSSAYFWVTGREWVNWGRDDTNRVDLIADKDRYAVGDVAEILIPSPYTGTVYALVTVERSGVLEREVRQLGSSSEVLEVPIREAYVPNVFVSVVLVQGSAAAPDGLASLKMGMVALPVSVEEKELQITLAPDREMAEGGYYHPRETAVYDLQVTDHDGSPVEAEFSLRLADLAVLALADDTAPTLMERFWSERGVGLRTTASLIPAMEAHNRELEPKAKGGGGGDENLIRTNFADTAFWDPVVRTGADGRARVEVKLPDNLTTWRMQARGITADTRVGRSEVDVLSTLDLLVRPVLPRFFVVGDRAEIATIVHNNTTQTRAVDVSVKLSGLSLEGASRQSVEIAPGGKAKVVWPVTAEFGEEVKVRMEAEADGYHDGREDTLPVYHYTTPEVVATAGRLSEPGFRQELVVRDPDFDAEYGELRIQLDASLTAATRRALDYLRHYPYECVEQTVSRFLPNLMTYQVLETMGVDDPELRTDLEEQVNVALPRLYARQRYDGGWGWWSRDKSQSYLTAYVLQGLLEAYRAGFDVDRDVMHKAYRFTVRHRPKEIEHRWEANQLAYQLYVQGLYADVLDEEKAGDGALGLAVNLYEQRHDLDRYGVAYLALALNVFDPEDASRDEGSHVESLLNELRNDAIQSATGTHWEEGAPDYWNMNTDVRSTAIVIWSLAQLRPEDDLLPPAVRWLMSARREGHWSTTQTTTWSLMALVHYMKGSGELDADFGYVLYLNDRPLDRGSFDRDNLDESQVVEVAISDLLVEEANRLIFEREPGDGERSGEGQLYYTAHLRYFVPAEDVEPLDRGLVVARQYTRLDDPEVAVDTAQVGDLIRVRLTVVAPHDAHYVVVEDPLPAGCEAVDMQLETTSVVGERPQMRNLTLEEENAWYRRYGWGWWWFSHTEMRDEKVALFATHLPRGTYEYTYVMRAGVPGTFKVMPTVAYPMYFPEIFGRGAGEIFTVREME